MKKLDIFAVLAAKILALAGRRKPLAATAPNLIRPSDGRPQGGAAERKHETPPRAFGGTGTGRKLARGLDPQAVARAMAKAGRG